MRQRITRLLERWLDFRAMGQLPAGFDLAHDIARWLPDLKVEVIFDIGGNVGQSALRFAQQFPGASIYSFEPGNGIYEQLVSATTDVPRISCHKVALGARADERLFVLKNLISHLAQEGENLDGMEVHNVNVQTLDSFCRSYSIDHITLLKIDTEGHDLDVLRGGENLISRAGIDIIQVEAGLHPLNERHVGLRAFQDWLEERGYFLFGFYEQTHEFNGEPQLRRADVAFVSPHLRAAQHIC